MQAVCKSTLQTESSLVSAVADSNLHAWAHMMDQKSLETDDERISSCDYVKAVFPNQKTLPVFSLI